MSNVWRQTLKTFQTWAVFRESSGTDVIKKHRWKTVVRKREKLREYIFDDFIFPMRLSYSFCNFLFSVILLYFYDELFVYLNLLDCTSAFSSKWSLTSTDTTCLFLPLHPGLWNIHVSDPEPFPFPFMLEGKAIKISCEISA